jgi:hypothetical protein
MGGVEMQNCKPQTVSERWRGFSDMHCRKEQKPLATQDFERLMIKGLMLFGSDRLLLLEDVKSPQAHGLMERSMHPI